MERRDAPALSVRVRFPILESVSGAVLPDRTLRACLQNFVLECLDTGREYFGKVGLLFVVVLYKLFSPQNISY